MITPQMEEYLEAIGKLRERDEPVTPSALARECKVAPPTVTEMLHRLSEQGYITYEPRGPIDLTASGATVASTVIRRHRLWERFLHDVLGLRWDQVHDQACQLEHVTSPELEQRLTSLAGDPDTCPHGHPIPEGDTVLEDTPTITLADLLPHQPARVVRVEEDTALLRRLAAVGVTPGAVLRLEDRDSGSKLVVHTAGASRPLATADAARVDVVACEPDNSEADREPVIPLGDLAPGESAVIHSFHAGRSVVARCLALGFTPGAPVRIIQNLRGGPVIALVRDTRVALGRGESQHILVTRQTERTAAPARQADTAAAHA